MTPSLQLPPGPLEAVGASLLPHGWQRVRLGDVAQLCLGKMLDAKKNRGRKLPYLRNPNVRWFEVDLSDLREMPFEEHELDRYGLRCGDVLVCEGGEAGRAAIWKSDRDDVKFQKAIHRVRPGPELHNRYLVHRLRTDYLNGRLADYYTGATIKHLTGQDLARYEFPLPPIHEQRRIAEVLDRAEALRAKRCASLSQLDELRQSVFLEMFGDPRTNTKAWPLKEVGTLLAAAEVFTDGDWVESKDQDPEGEVRLVQLADIGDGAYLDKSARFLTKQTAQRLGCTFLRAGDVLVARMPDPLGRACLFPGDRRECVTVVDVCVIRPGKLGPDPAWLMSCINSPGFRQQIATQATGTTRQRISRGNLSRLTVIAPPVSLQREFARRMLAIDEVRAHQQTAIAKCNELLSSLQQRAFVGQI